MKLSNFYTFLFLFFSAFTNAQLGKETWHWHFGQHSSIDFSSGTPVYGTSAINTVEGCATISDPNSGQLLFYTDGDTVWDRNNNKMPNGIGLIGGGYTTTQAATIVPKPDSSNIYYLITADDGFFVEPNQGVFYSVIDMNLNGGLGDVRIKNILLTPPPTTEKAVATRHCNGVDYWILTHSYGSNNFNAYQITSSGINTTPVISSIGTIEKDTCCSDGSSVGYLKVSPNGKKLALCISIFSPTPLLEIYDFDNSTGQVSNPISIPINIGGPYYGPYGCSFSPDNTKIYISTNGSDIFQFDLSSGVPNTIISSQTSLGISSTGALQLATDGKIYINLGHSLGVINSPNSAGTACNYQANVIATSSGPQASEGLPNFIDAGLSNAYACTIGINEIQNKESEITIYPNPSDGNFTITNNYREAERIEIMDITSNLVGTYILPATASYLEVNNDNLQNGVYLFRVISNGSLLKVGKIVIMK